MATDPATSSVSTDVSSVLADRERPAEGGVGPWRLAGRRLKRNKVALAFGAMFIVLVLIALAAPIWANEIAKTTPERNRVADVIKVDGQGRQRRVARRRADRPHLGRASSSWAPTPTAATSWCACSTARATRSSSASLAALLTTFLAVVAGLVRRLLPRLDRRRHLARLDVMWAFPVLLLASPSASRSPHGWAQAPAPSPSPATRCGSRR
jgi:peptide/nickel transport system permease protein